MKLGIIGKPQSGKTTVFNASSGKLEAVGGYSKTVHRSVIKVPDERVNILADMINPQLGESILDPTCGTGGFLPCAIEH